jgi:O-antigen/teichoic acid export membrane protein
VKRLFDNSLITFVDYVVLVGLNLIATPLLIDNFGVDGYGAFVFLSIFSIYGALAVFDLGMEGALMNYIARFHAVGERLKMHATVTMSVLYYAVIGALLGLGIYFGSNMLAARLLDDQASISPVILRNAIIVVAINIFFQFISIPVTATLQGMRRYVVTKSVNSVTTIIRYVLLVTVALMYQRIDIGFAVVLCLTMVRLVSLGYILFRRTPGFAGWRPRFDLSLFRTVFSYSAILFVTRIIGLVHNQSPKMLIWYFLPVASMTIYDIVARPAMLLRVIMGVIISALIPEAAQLHEQGKLKEIRKLYINLVRYAYLMILPMLAILFAHINTLVGAWVGQQFEPYAYLALILLAGYLILPVSAVANTMVVGLEKVRQTIWIPIVGTSLNLLLSATLLHFIGLPGLFVGALASQMFTVVPYARYMGRLLEFTTNELIGPVLPLFAVAGVSFGLNWVAGSVLQEQLPGLITVAFITGAANLLVNLRFFLKPGERRFLVERLRGFREKLSPDTARG